MKKQKRQESKPAGRRGSPRWWSPPWWYWLVGFGALFLVFEAYGPALRSPFILDDLYLPYADANPPHSLLGWVRLQRPLLMFSFWVDYQMGGGDPHGYHVTNVLLHFAASIVVMLIAARFLGWAGVVRTHAASAGDIFGGALSIASAANGIGRIHRQQIRSVERLVLLFGVRGFHLCRFHELPSSDRDRRIIRRGGRQARNIRSRCPC